MLFVETDGLSYEDHCRIAEYEHLHFSHPLIVPPEITFRWYQYNPCTMVAVRDEASREIVGHLGTVPLKDEVYRRYRSGGFRGVEMGAAIVEADADIIVKYDKPGPYVLYCFATAVHPDYMGKTKALQLLLDGFTETFLKLAAGGVYVSELYGRPVTPEGIKLCRILNMTPDIGVDPRFYGNKKTVTLFRSASRPLKDAIVPLYRRFFAAREAAVPAGRDLDGEACS